MTVRPPATPRRRSDDHDPDPLLPFRSFVLIVVPVVVAILVVMHPPVGIGLGVGVGLLAFLDQHVGRR